MLILYGVFFSLLVLNYCGDLIYKHYLNSKLTVAKNELINAQQYLTELSAKYQSSSLSTKLIENKSLVCQIKFSAYLEELSHAIPAGVWLNYFNLTSNGTQVVLKGNAIKASLVEEFLARLNKEPEFLSKVFEIQELDQMNETPVTPGAVTQYLGFTLITKA